MDRRKALKTISLLGFGLSGFVGLNQSCNNMQDNSDVIRDNKNLVEIVSEIGNIIIPDTITPGAAAGKVGPFILMMIDECYPENIRRRFNEGILNMDTLSKKKYGKEFLKLSSDKKKVIVDGAVREEEELKKSAKNHLSKNLRPYFFELFFNLTLLGYFTSEVGCTQVLQYDHIPGKYDGCVEIGVDHRAWAT